MLKNEKPPVKAIFHKGFPNSVYSISKYIAGAENQFLLPM